MMPGSEFSSCNCTARRPTDGSKARSAPGRRARDGRPPSGNSKGGRDALAAHCPLDLRGRSFPVGAVARSLLGEAGIFIAREADVAGETLFRLIVDQTMAHYAVRLLAAAGRH
jgi:hypothetical protein